MLIYDALKDDHKKVRQLLKELTDLNKNNESDRHELIGQIRDELIPHARAEELVFYNTLRNLKVTKDLVMHGYKEHLEAETLLRLLQVRDKIDTEWKENAIKLQKALDEHIQYEEQEIFPEAKKHFTEEEARMMGDAFVKLKPGIRREGFVGTTLDLVANLMPTRFSGAFRKNEIITRL